MLVVGKKLLYSFGKVAECGFFQVGIYLKILTVKARVTDTLEWRWSQSRKKPITD
jgi:hypothetical protein